MYLWTGQRKTASGLLGFDVASTASPLERISDEKLQNLELLILGDHQCIGKQKTEICSSLFVILGTVVRNSALHE